MKIIQITHNQNGEIVFGLGDDGELYELWYRLKSNTEQWVPPAEPALGFCRGYWDAEVVENLWVPAHKPPSLEQLGRDGQASVMASLGGP